jgi:pyrophosphate--fructose-6-phosphate 1-phosphotransferase
MPVKKVAMLTAGGLAPCLSSAVAGLIKQYTRRAPDVDIICYRDGYKGLLLGHSIRVDQEMRDKAHILYQHGGSPIGNSRVKLTNVKDCVKRGLVKEGEDPQKVAADQLTQDEIDVLHTIGGDDTNGAAADLAKYLKINNYDLTVVGLPKTIDNDVIPIQQSLGAWTAAEQAARFFRNIVAEHSANPRMLIVHEVMGRSCGWLTAYAAKIYREHTHELEFVPGIGLSMDRNDIHGIFVPEMEIDLAAEAQRLKAKMDAIDCVNIFVSEGAGIGAIIAEMEAQGQEVPRDAFGHPKLDAVNPGAWFGKQFADMIGAEKTMVQKSGYFSRAAASNAQDLQLIKDSCDLAVECALRGESGVIGQDEERGGALRAIEFERIKGGKPFNIESPWFVELLEAIGQPVRGKVAVAH